MPSKNKTQVNGFWLFAQHNKSRWKTDGLRVGNNQELLGIASPFWKSLSPQQKKEWDQQAKEERRLRKNENGDMRLDNIGEIIGNRVDPVEQARKRRERELNIFTSQWQGRDLVQEKFYFVNFQEMVELSEGDNTAAREWLPREVALVEYSLKDGISQVYHQFIWPGDIPMGYRQSCEALSQSTHQIPASKMDADLEDYVSIWKRVLQVMKAGMRDRQYPPVYCLSNDYEKMKFFMDWLWMRGTREYEDGDNPLGKVYSLEDMVCQLLAFSGKPGTENVSKVQVIARLDGSQWDYLPTTTCDFHKEQDVSRYCALAVVRRIAYTVSDMVGLHYGINLSERHVPVRDDDAAPIIRVLPPQAVPVPNRLRARGRGRPKQPQPSNEESYGPITEAKLARQKAQEEEEFAGRDMTEEEIYARKPANTMLKGVIFDGRKYGAPPEAPAGPASGQFDDWPSLGGEQGGGPAKQDESSSDQDDTDFPSLPMSHMTLSDVTSAWMAGGGRGTTTALPAEQRVAPPPGLGTSPGAGRGLQPEAPQAGRNLARGRGAPPLANRKPSSAPVDTAPAVGRTDPQPSIWAESGGMVGTGSGGGLAPQSAGRGYTPPLGRGSTPPFGRGAMPSAGREEIAGVGRDQPPVNPVTAAREDVSTVSVCGQAALSSWGQPAVNHLGQPAVNNVGPPGLSHLGYPGMNHAGQAAINTLVQPAGNLWGQLKTEQLQGGGLATQVIDFAGGGGITSQARGAFAAAGVVRGPAEALSAGRGFTSTAGRGFVPPSRVEAPGLAAGGSGSQL